MRSLFAPDVPAGRRAPDLPIERLPPERPGRSSHLRRRPLSARLRLGLELVDRASAALLRAPAEARALAATALVTSLPTTTEERSPAARHLLPLAADLAATAYCVEAESWLLEGRTARSATPAALARLLALHGSGDPLVFGAVEAMLGLRAWLRGSLGRSLRHLEGAILHFAEVGENRHEAEAWERTAAVLEQAGLVAEAESALQRAHELALRLGRQAVATEPLRKNAIWAQESRKKDLF